MARNLTIDGKEYDITYSHLEVLIEHDTALAWFARELLESADDYDHHGINVDDTPEFDTVESSA